jgi:hypothetical protein
MHVKFTYEGNDVRRIRTSIGYLKRGHDNARYAMSLKHAKQLKGERTSISRTALESIIAETVRAKDSQFAGLIAVIVERTTPVSPGGANWVVKGVKYGKTDRDLCGEAISTYVEEAQRQYEVSE